MNTRPTYQLTGLHPESLLNIPLVAQMFGDPDFKLIRRGIDSRWHYARIVSSRLDGFNPLIGAAFIGRHSHFDRWVKHRGESARRFNAGDALVPEVLFAVHDYLHAWAYRWVAELCPQIGFATARITRKNFEDMVFCHLLTEAAATVGLDYWYLSCLELNDVVPIGTAQKGLTVSYSESFDREYRLFAPDLKVQNVEFFSEIVRFYCDGIFRGFSARDLTLSPVVLAWLQHELSYGQQQRKYSRQWFSYLSRGQVRLSDADLIKPARHAARFKKKLMREIGERLWVKVKENQLVSADLRFDPDQIWASGPDDKYEYQFINLNRTRTPSEQAVREMSDESFAYLLRQYVSRFDFGVFPGEAHEIFQLMKKQRSLSLGKKIFRGFKRLPTTRSEPRDVFFYN